MPTPTLATVTALEMIALRENHRPTFPIKIITFNEFNERLLSLHKFFTNH